MSLLPTWPIREIGAALEALAVAARLAEGGAGAAQPPVEEGGGLDRWMEVAAARMGLEVEAIDAFYADVPRTLAGVGPALLRLPGEPPSLVVILRGNARWLWLLAPSGGRVRVPLEDVRAAWTEPHEAKAAGLVDPVLESAGVPPARRKAARDVLLAQVLRLNRCRGCWMLRLPPEASLVAQGRLAGLGRELGLLIAAHALSYTLFLFGWGLIGKAALQGRLDLGWMAAWALVLLSAIPLKLLVTWSQGVFALGVGALIKRRLLQGALRLDPDETKHEGVGASMGRVIESEAVESLALSGGIVSVLSLLELAGAGWVLSRGAGGWLHVALLAAWAGVTLAAGARYTRQRERWTDERMGQTSGLIEQMVGHRTRLAQQPPDRWHGEEDRALARYLRSSADLDRGLTHLVVTLPRAWMILAILGFAPAFVAGSTPALLAVGLGGMMLGGQALNGLTNGLSQLAGAWIAWKRVGPLFAAASRAKSVGDPAALASADPAAPLVEARELVFRYRPAQDPVIDRASIAVQPGDRLLLEGPSGGGKSTLASLIVGLRSPESGLLLLSGLDGATLGADGWRRKVVCAPQFHENHVLANTFAFNLLLGRSWPPAPGDEEAAEEVCRELGLDAVLARMPGGLMQMVGETGWQLSHGEKSRLYIARALLQDADLVVLDESFAALDPENLRLALECVLRRAKTLLVIAHP